MHTVGFEIDERARRLGLGQARNVDVISDVQLSMLKLFCSHLDQAMEDEGVDPDTARNVLVRVIQGSLPHPTDAQLRLDATAQAIFHAERGERPPLAGVRGESGVRWEGGASSTSFGH